MKTKKKNRFLTFCFSLIPGAGEMYMGFMKSGFSLMLVFYLLIVLSMMLSQGVLAALSIIVWFYSFFHANHLASLGDEDFAQVKDEFLFGLDDLPGMKGFVKRYNRWIAYALIFVGICLLWNTAANIVSRVLPEEYDYIARMMYNIGDFIPSVIFGIAIVILGIKLIAGKEMKAYVYEQKEQLPSAEAEVKYVGAKESENGTSDNQNP